MIIWTLDPTNRDTPKCFGEIKKQKNAGYWQQTKKRFDMENLIYYNFYYNNNKYLNYRYNHNKKETGKG